MLLWEPPVRSAVVAAGRNSSQRAGERCPTRYNGTPGSQAYYTGPVTVSQEGDYWFAYNCWDNAGNAASADPTGSSSNNLPQS